MACHDWDGDGENTFADDFLEYQIFNETMGENDDNSSFGFSNNNRNGISSEKLQKGYNIFVFGALLLLGIVSPIYTIIGFAIDPKYFFDDWKGILFIIVTIIELVALLIYLCAKIKDSSKRDTSDCKANENVVQSQKSAKREKITKYVIFGISIIVICGLIGLSSYIKKENSYQNAINEAINSERLHKSVKNGQ